MDPRRTSRVIDPKVRQVGFFTATPRPNRHQNQLDRTGPSLSSPASNVSSSGSANTLSPVMIPPLRHHSDAASRAVDVPAATRRPPFHHDSSVTDAGGGEQLIVGSYKPDESVLGTLPPLSGIGDEDGEGDAESEFSEDYSVNWNRQHESGKFRTSPTLPEGGFNSPPVDAKKGGEPKNADGGFNEGRTTEVWNEIQPASKPLKEKTSKAERRALQEAQRAAKAAAKGPPSEVAISS